MWTRIRETLADWYILIIFVICLGAVGLFATATTQHSSTPTAQGPARTNVAKSQEPQRPPSEPAPTPSQPAQKTPTRPAGSTAASVPPPDQSAAAKSAAGSTAASVPPPDQSAAAKQTSPAASHDRDTQTMAANAPARSSTDQPGVAAPRGGGAPAAGRLVY